MVALTLAFETSAVGTCGAADWFSMTRAAKRIQCFMSIGNREGDDAGTCRNRDVLLAVEHVGHGRSPPGLIGRKTRNRLAGRGVGGHQVAALFAENHEAGSCRQRTAPRLRRSRLRQLPADGP